MAETIVQTVYCGKTPNGVQQLNRGLDTEVFSPILVVESITKLSLGRRCKCFTSALDVIDKCLSNLRCYPGDNCDLTVCKTISRATFWILENTTEVYKTLYTSLKDDVLTHDPEVQISIIQKAQKLLKKLIFNSSFCSLNFIGKLSFPGEFSSLPIQTKEVLNLPLDKIKLRPLYNSFESNLKEFVNCVTRFLNTSPMFLDFERPCGAIPSQQLFTFLQFQVSEYLSVTCKKMADILDNWLKVENIPVDQAFVNIFRFSIHNVLTRNDHLEQMFIGFMIFKLPNILSQLNAKYSKQNNGQSIVVPICQRLSVLNLDDINATLNCDMYKIFLMQCQSNRSLDAKQTEQLLSLRQAPSLDENTDANILPRLMAAAKKNDDILKTLALPLEGNRESISQEMITLIASVDLDFILATLACTDGMNNFVMALMRINKFAERCPPGAADVHADLRADLFNNSFLLLNYTATKLGDVIYIDVDDTYSESFFSKWRRSCTDVTSRKLYTQTVLDQMLEPISTSHNPQNNNAQWDEYCWSVGMIVKELTQAHLRRRISTEDLQKVCEGFKNKRPALCIGAMTWLCSQYKTMPVSERQRTVKIINLFKRRTKAALLTPILNKYSIPLEHDLHAATTKNKSATPEQPKSAGEVFTSILKEVCPSNKKVLLDFNILTNIRRWRAEFGVATFAESIVKLILHSGKEEEAKLYEELCVCLLLMDPIKLLREVFTRVLKSFFLYSASCRTFSDPHGSCLARCLSRAFVTSLMLFDRDNAESDAPRPAKIQKMNKRTANDYDALVDSFVSFLNDAAILLSRKKKDAVSTFILNLIEQIAMTTSLLKPAIIIDETVAGKILEQLPSDTSRDTLTMLCDLSSIKGQEVAARFLLRRTSFS